MTIHETEKGIHLSFNKDSKTDMNEARRMVYLMGCYGPFMNYQAKFERMVDEVTKDKMEG